MIRGRLTMCNQVRTVTLQSCVQLTAHATVVGQIWFKNLVKIWSEKIWSKSGQNLVRQKNSQKSAKKGLEQMFECQGPLTYPICRNYVR
jgi:DNA-binding transcriptional regulator/RsmH inhibitor MraZ